MQLQHRGHIIELKPNNAQSTHLKKACGVARFAYNWALAEWKKQYEQDKAYCAECLSKGIDIDKNKLNSPNHFKLKKQFNAIKHEQFPFILEVTKCSSQEAIIQLGKAFNNFFKGLASYPKFRKKGVDDKFTLTSDQVKLKLVKNKPFIQIPKVGLVRMRENLRFKGKNLSAKVFTRGGRWFVSITVELNSDEVINQLKINQTTKTGERCSKAVGIDLGIIDLATLSDGTKIQAPKPLKSKLKKLKRLSKQFSRKQKGSKNRVKAKTKLARLHFKISNIRKDFLHKLTTDLVKKFDVICLENLNIRGMVKNRKLSRAISDLGLYELKRQLIYKAQQWSGAEAKTIKEVGMFYPSSKTCSCCGFVMNKLPLNIRNWQCPQCNTLHDRDINASINILNQADKVLTLL